MAEIRGLIAATVDGYIASPDGDIGWLEEFGEFDYGYDTFIAQIDIVVIGRRTYDQVQERLGWPYAGKRAVIVTHTLSTRRPDQRLRLLGGLPGGFNACPFLVEAHPRQPPAGPPSRPPPAIPQGEKLHKFIMFCYNRGAFESIFSISRIPDPGETDRVLPIEDQDAIGSRFWKEVPIVSALEAVLGREVRFEDPPVAKTLFGDTRWSWLWLILRVWLGWEWLQAGWGKVGSAAWTGANAGAAVSGFIQGALQRTTGPHPDVQAWYAWFLQNVAQPNASLFSHLVAWGEVLVGVALIVGAFTGIAAFFGSFMNMSYMLAGTVSTNPVLFAVATWLVLAWKTAGWIGLDRWLLPLLGTPWRPGKLFRREGEWRPSTQERASEA